LKHCNCYRDTRGVTMQAHARLWEKHTGRGSIGAWAYLTSTPWYVVVKDAIFCSPEIHAVASIIDHTNHVAFFNLGVDLVVPFKKAKGGFTHIFVALDKFTKWIKVKSIASITAAKVVEFIKNIMYKFSVPNDIITDNRTQFTARGFKDLCRLRHQGQPSFGISPAE
jgi:hypothetical protein